jgi:hypothetical protein
LNSGIGFLALVALTLAATFLFLWRTRRRAPESQKPRRSAAQVPEVWMLVDGSNVMHWQDGGPTLYAVKGVVEKLIALGYVPGVIFDANAGWKLKGRYIHDGEFSVLLGIEKRQVLVVEKGTQADPFLLQTAREFGARIVTNDRFRDWADKHPEVLREGFLVRGGMRDGKVWLHGVKAVQNPAAA